MFKNAGPKIPHLPNFEYYKKLVYYAETVSYIFLKKAFLIFRKRKFSYILGKLYSEPKAYSEHC